MNPAADPAAAAPAAVSRSNLRLLLATKRELGRLAEVQRLLEGEPRLGEHASRRVCQTL